MSSENMTCDWHKEYLIACWRICTRNYVVMEPRLRSEIKTGWHTCLLENISTSLLYLSRFCKIKSNVNDRVTVLSWKLTWGLRYHAIFLNLSLLKPSLLIMEHRMYIRKWGGKVQKERWMLTTILHWCFIYSYKYTHYALYWPAAARLCSANLNTSSTSFLCSSVNWLIRELYQLGSFPWRSAGETWQKLN